jgi:hypothetical protein
VLIVAISWKLHQNKGVDASLLKYPLKSHRKIVSLPSDTVKLAELLGIVYGDGGIGNKWQVVISLNSVSDATYSVYVSQLIEELFSIKPVIRKRPNQHTLTVVLSSTSVVDFLVYKGAVRGNKLLQLRSIPRWIKDSMDYSRYFVRGIIDTDGCIYLHKHCKNEVTYVNIGLCFTNFSPKLVIDIFDTLRMFGVKGYIADKGRRIYIYSWKEIEKYLSIFGSSNPRIWEKYSLWRDARAV